MRTLCVTLALLAGCSSDPCAGRSGTCIALTVEGSASGIDALAVTVDQPTTKTESTPPKPLTLPVSLGLDLPSSVAGVVDITVVATSQGAFVAEGLGTANVSHNRGAATVTLVSASQGGDLGSAPTGAPAAPTNVQASSGNAQATVTWSPPGDTGASAIASYVVTASPGGITVVTPDGATTMATVAGLTNDTTYTFTVSARNDAGTGPASAASNPVTPTATPMVPSAPTMVTAVADVDHGAHVSWTGADNHGSPLVGYAISATQLTGTLATAAPTATSAVVTGLTPGSQYTFAVVATNGVGSSNASFPSNAIVAATRPDAAPTGVSATADVDHGASVRWTAPATSGYSPITAYTIVAAPGGMTATVAGTKTSGQITGLTVGSSYSFTVFASNVVGDGPPSAASSAVAVLGKLAAPAGVAACGHNGKVNVSFGAVSGAQSYDVFYSATSPATGGSKLNVASSPATITVPNGSYHLAVAAVSPVGDGALSAEVTARADNQVHDTLFVGATDNSTVDIYDCYSQLADGTSMPTRTLTGVGAESLTVDAANNALFVGDTGTVRIWLDATNVSGAATADYSIPLAGWSLALDPTHKKLYVGTGAQTIQRYGYTQLSDLNGATQEAIFFAPVGSGQLNELSVDPATGNLWGSSSTSSGANPQCGAIGYYAAAYNLGDQEQATKYLHVTNTCTIYGLWYAPGNGGTLYTGDTALWWFGNIDSAANATVLSPTTSTTISVATQKISVGGGLLVVLPRASTPPLNGQVLAYSLSNPSGAPVKTVSSPNTHGNSGSVFYVP
jgi:hypothetical protein